MEARSFDYHQCSLECWVESKHTGNQQGSGLGLYRSSVILNYERIRGGLREKRLCCFPALCYRDPSRRRSLGKKTIPSPPDDVHWEMGWEISDLFPLVICQIRNHEANNGFWVRSEEFFSVRRKAFLGPEALAFTTNLRGPTVFHFHESESRSPCLLNIIGRWTLLSWSCLSFLFCC